MKVEIISTSDGDLEYKVNQFIEKNVVCVTDVKFTEAE